MTYKKWNKYNSNERKIAIIVMKDVHIRDVLKKIN